MPKDNSTQVEKVRLRRAALAELGSPAVVCETHGGLGQLYAACYTGVAAGVVFERNPDRTAILARQRPTWAVYEADAVVALAAGAGAHLLVNLLDVDPWGEPWLVLGAWFGSVRPRAPRLVVVVNDGLRRNIQLGRAWSVHSLAGVVARYGNNLHARYLAVCEELLGEYGSQAGYRLASFTGYHCGYDQQMTHYAGIFTAGPAAEGLPVPPADRRADV